MTLKYVLGAREMQKDSDKHSDDFTPKEYFSRQTLIWLLIFKIAETIIFHSSEISFLEFSIQL